MISRSRRTLGVRAMPDGLDSGYCTLGDGAKAVVRVNLDGIWTCLCEHHRDTLLLALMFPAEKPEKPQRRTG